MKAILTGWTAAVLTAMALTAAPPAWATTYVGNYELHIPDRYDFHTWVWAARACPQDCLTISAIPRPIAKAFPYKGTAYLADGRFTLTVDVPDGLRCDNVYYGPVIPTRDVYSWDVMTFTGTLQSSFATGCGGAPGGTFTYPITLTRM